MREEAIVGSSPGDVQRELINDVHLSWVAVKVALVFPVNVINKRIDLPRFKKLPSSSCTSSPNFISSRFFVSDSVTRRAFQIFMRTT